MKGHTKRALALLFSAALLAGACGDSDDTDTGAGGAGGGNGGDGGAAAEGDSTGTTDSEVVLGTSNALSGPASAYAVITGGLEACVSWINSNGGVTMADGTARNLRLVAYDDGYDPAKTVENVRRLIEQDEVFALWAVLGSPPNAAIYDYTNGEEVPNLYVATGASRWGAGFIGDHPWTIGWQPTYSTEAAIYATYLQENEPDARVGILYQNDDFGRDYVEPFKTAIEGSGVEIVAELSYEVTDPTVDQQVTELASSGADVFLNITTPKFAAQAIAKKAELGWDATHLLTSVSASVGAVLEPAGFQNAAGIITAQYYKDPTDPNWDTDPGMMQYEEVMAEHGPGLDTDDAYVLFAWGQCETMKHTLENSQPTRESVMETVGNLDDVEIGMLLPGIVLSTGPEDGFPIETMQLVQFDGADYQDLGEPISYEGETPVLED